MIEVYINPNFKQDAEHLKNRVKNFNFFQVASPEEFWMVNGKNRIKFECNPYCKQFNLIAN